MTKSKRSVSDQRKNYFKLCLQLFVSMGVREYGHYAAQV